MMPSAHPPAAASDFGRRTPASTGGGAWRDGVEADVVQLDGLAVDRHRLTGEQAADGT